MKYTLTVGKKKYEAVVTRRSHIERNGQVRRPNHHRVFHGFDVIPFPEAARHGGPKNPAFVQYKKDYRKALQPVFTEIARVLKFENDRFTFNPRSGCACSCSPAYERERRADEVPYDIEVIEKYAHEV